MIETSAVCSAPSFAQRYLIRVQTSLSHISSSEHSFVFPTRRSFIHSFIHLLVCSLVHSGLWSVLCRLQAAQETQTTDTQLVCHNPPETIWNLQRCSMLLLKFQFDLNVSFPEMTEAGLKLSPKPGRRQQNLTSCF